MIDSEGLRLVPVGKPPAVHHRKSTHSQTFGRFGIALAALLFSCSFSLSKSDCEYRNVFGLSFAPEANHAGEFHVVLQPPDYQNDVSVQQHFIFSSVWGSAIRERLIKQTNSRCDAVLAKESFPNLRVFLIDRRPEVESTKSNAVPCDDELRSILNLSLSKDEIILSSSAEELIRKLLRLAVDQINISALVNDALPEIYELGTFMRALFSVEPSSFGLIKIDEFFAWLTRQQDGHAIELRRLQFCEPGYEFAADAARVANRPRSGVMPPGELSLPFRSSLPLSPSLRRFVIVGAGPALSYSPSSPEAMRKYCNQVVTLSEGLDIGGPSSARIKCRRNLYFNDSWTVFYCDPADCTSAEITELVMKQIVNDRSLLSFGGQRTLGPYTVTVYPGASQQ